MPALPVAFISMLPVAFISGAFISGAFISVMPAFSVAFISAALFALLLLHAASAANAVAIASLLVIFMGFPLSSLGRPPQRTAKRSVPTAEQRNRSWLPIIAA